MIAHAVALIAVVVTTQADSTYAFVGVSVIPMDRERVLVLSQDAEPLQAVDDQEYGGLVIQTGVLAAADRLGHLGDDLFDVAPRDRLHRVGQVFADGLQAAGESGVGGRPVQDHERRAAANAPRNASPIAAPISNANVTCGCWR